MILYCKSNGYNVFLFRFLKGIYLWKYYVHLLAVLFERILFVKILLVVFIAKCLLSSCQHATFRHPFYRWVIFFLNSYDFACLTDLMPPSLFFLLFWVLPLAKTLHFESNLHQKTLKNPLKSFVFKLFRHFLRKINIDF